MNQRCERCLKALPTEHVGDPLCGPCRRDAGLRNGYLHLVAAGIRHPGADAASDTPHC